LLHRAHFERTYASGLAKTSGGFRGLVFAMMAAASRFSDDPRVLHRYPWLGEIIGEPDTMARGYSFFFATMKLLFTVRVVMLRGSMGLMRAYRSRP
jgi:hypothetical protein